MLRPSWTRTTPLKITPTAFWFVFFHVLFKKAAEFYGTNENALAYLYQTKSLVATHHLCQGWEIILVREPLYNIFEDSGHTFEKLRAENYILHEVGPTLIYALVYHIGLHFLKSFWVAFFE